MGKRSDFERIDKDFYRTIDKRAVEALLPVLFEVDGATTFAEPCYGYGDLAIQLQDYGLQCNWASDIRSSTPEDRVFWRERDALSLTKDVVEHCEVIITNPPWTRTILHPMISKFIDLKPTWLLFDADWMHTKQSAPYMKLCSHIVSIGRLIWIPGTKVQGKDNCAWYRFDYNNTGRTQFYGRDDSEERPTYTKV